MMVTTHLQSHVAVVRQGIQEGVSNTYKTPCVTVIMMESQCYFIGSQELQD